MIGRNIFTPYTVGTSRKHLVKVMMHVRDKPSMKCPNINIKFKSILK